MLKKGGETMTESDDRLKRSDQIKLLEVVLKSTDTGEWERQPIAVDVEHTMEELLKYNHIEEEGVVDKKEL